jgi:FKBP-type peptidyl-prolyl cis-trans isomerase FklB
MKKTMALIALSVFFAVQVSSGDTTGSKVTVSANTFTAQKSYMMGTETANQLKGLNTPIDIDAFVQGFTDVMKDHKLLLSKTALDSIRQVFMGQLREQQMTGAKESSRKGEEFLAANKAKPGVITTASGLQYIVEKMGTGPRPKLSDRVKVNYEGSLIDGKIFDSSIKRGQPAEFQVSGVIAGWTEALQLMPVGSKFKLFVPAALAYGDRGAGPDIGPGAMLIFEVELLSIEQ